MNTDSYTYINLEYLYQIADGENDFVIEMITDYVNQIPSQFGDLQTTLTSGDLKQTGFIAHKMKSSFQFMGVQQLVEASSMIEQLSAENATEKVIAQVELMKPLLANVLVELNHKLASL